MKLFDGDDELFKNLIKKSNIYFEYGCGLSTEYVYKNTNCKIFSVDTSLDWINKIKNIEKKEENRLNLTWIDVGDIGDWGYPLSYKKRENFSKYANFFWTLNLKPDLVLIDGRFRVYCFLMILKYALEGTKVLFDDYTNRSYYHVAEEYLPIIEKCGRQVLFEITGELKKNINDTEILSFSNVLL